MAKVQHTEGPWAYEHYDGVITSSQGVICRLYDLDGESFQDIMTTRRNGNLISSAPDLLAERDALRQRIAVAEAALRAVDEAFVSGDNAAMQGAIRQACVVAGMTAGEAGK